MHPPAEEASLRKQPLGFLQSLWELHDIRMCAGLCFACLEGECRAGLRNLVETMLTGQILVHWDFLCSLLGEKGTSLVRCELTSGAVLIGLMIPRNSLETWRTQQRSSQNFWSHLLYIY